MAKAANFYVQAQDLCLADCVGTGTSKVCTFHIEVDLFASELGYFTVSGCDGVMPTLGIEKDVYYKFSQENTSNYYHPLGLAYYADGAHDDVDELEPGIVPPGSASACAVDNTCPAPMYMRGGQYLGVYSNNAAITPLTTDEDDFGLDVYEPEFFLDPVTWNDAGSYEIGLFFDTDDFVQDIFYFCHVSTF